MLDDGSLRIVPPTTTVALIIGMVKCIIVQSFLNHANSLLLMAEGCKTAECHIVCPVESTEVLRVFHSIGPVGLRFEVLSDLATLRLVFLLGLLIGHQGAIQNVHFMCLLTLFRIHLLHKLVQLLSCPLAYFVHLALAQVLLLLASDVIAAFWHFCVTDCEIAA